MIGKSLKYYIWTVRVKGEVETCGLNRHNLNLFLDAGHQHSSAWGVQHCSWYSQVTYLWYPLFPNNTSFSWGIIVPVSVSQCSSTFCTSMAPSLKSPCAELVCFQSNNISRRANLLSNWFLFYIYQVRQGKQFSWESADVFFNFNILNSNWVTTLKVHSIGLKFGTLFRALITSQVQNYVKFSDLKCFLKKNQKNFLCPQKSAEGISYRDKIWIKRRSSPGMSNSFYITGHKQLTLILNGPHQLKFPFVSV